MAIPVIVIGDDVAQYYSLTKQNATFTITPSSVVKATLVTLDRKTKLLTEVTQSNAASGADWANSLVAVEFSAAQTALIASTYAGNVFLEIQVEQGGKKTSWFTDVNLINGNIS